MQSNASNACPPSDTSKKPLTDVVNHISSVRFALADVVSNLRVVKRCQDEARFIALDSPIHFNKEEFLKITNGLLGVVSTSLELHAAFRRNATTDLGLGELNSLIDDVYSNVERATDIVRSSIALEQQEKEPGEQGSLIVTEVLNALFHR